LNVRGAFSVSDPARVAGRSILLVDDILTTGATARAAAQALIDAGADSVWVATLARAQRFDRSKNFSARENAELLAAAEPDQAADFSANLPSFRGQPSF
jgi:adenine/guanine phosphoribosyltransferase-like PRPP-binding protein